MFGFLNVYKPQGKTSHDVVAILRRITKIRQIGHTGTLDPFAEGVLPICIGKSTRLIEFLEDDKAYLATIKLGQSTTTYDLEGEVIKTSDKKVSEEEFNKNLSKFRGEILQKPPIYSAIKVKGKKLYEYARKGEEVEIESRKVNIYRLELKNFNEKNQTADVLIECSKGTYIRSIANDLGEELGCFAHLIKLVRIKAGKFELDNAIKLEDLQDSEMVKKRLLCPLDFLNYPKYELNDYEKEKVSHGMEIDINFPDGLTILVQKEKLIAVSFIKNKKAKVSKVFI